jgi:hypothetical protein
MRPFPNRRYLYFLLCIWLWWLWWWWRRCWNEWFWQEKSKYSDKTCTDATLSTTNPTCQTRARTRAAAVGSQGLTASAMAWPTSRRRRRKGKSQIWDSKIWLRVPRDSEPRKTALVRPAAYTRYRPVFSLERAPHENKTVTVIFPRE